MQTNIRSSLKTSLVEAATPYGADDMNLRVSDREVRIVTRNELAMRGVCRRLKEDKTLMGVSVGDDGLRTVVLTPSDNEGVKMFKDFMIEFGDTR